jgi:hypothetical protein
MRWHDPVKALSLIAVGLLIAFMFEPVLRAQSSGIIGVPPARSHLPATNPNAQPPGAGGTPPTKHHSHP